VRRHIDEDGLPGLGRELGGVHRRAQGHRLVGVETSERRSPEELGHHLAHQGDAGHPADQHHRLDVARLELGFGQHRPADLQAPAGQRFDERLEELPGQHRVELAAPPLRALAVGPQVCDRDEGLWLVGQRPLGPLRRVAQPLHRQAVPRHRFALALGDLGHEPLHDGGVKVVTAQVRVAARRLDLEDAIVRLEDGHVEGAAAEVEDERAAPKPSDEPVGDGGRRRLVHHAQDVEPGDARGLAGRLPLALVEVGRHGHDALRHRAAEVGLGVELELAQQHGRQLRHRHHPPGDLEPHLARRSGHERVRHHLLGRVRQLLAPALAQVALGRRGHPIGRLIAQHQRPIADDALAGRGETDDRGGQSHPAPRWNEGGLAILDGGDGRVSGAEVDADDGFHVRRTGGPSSPRSGSKHLGR